MDTNETTNEVVAPVEKTLGAEITSAVLVSLAASAAFWGVPIVINATASTIDKFKKLKADRQAKKNPTTD